MYKNLDFYRSDLRSTVASEYLRASLGEGLGGLVRASFVLYSLDKKALDAVAVGGFSWSKKSIFSFVIVISLMVSTGKWGHQSADWNGV